MGSGVVQSGLWPLAPAYGAQRSARPTWGVHSTERGRLARGVSVYFVDNGMRRAAECAPYLGSAFDGARASRPRHFGLLCRQRNAARSGVRALPGVCFRRSAGVSPAAFLVYFVDNGMRRAAESAPYLGSAFDGARASRPRHFGLLCRQRNAARSGERALPGECIRRSAGVSPAAFRSALSTTECGAQRSARPTWGVHSTERGRLARGISVCFVDNGRRRASECAPYLGSAFDGARASRPRHFGLLCRQRKAARSGVRALPGECIRRSAGVSPAAFRSALSTTECGAQRRARPTWGLLSTERGRLARGVSVCFVDNGMRRAAESAPYLGSAFDGARASRPRHFGLLCRQRNAARSGERALPGVCFRRSAGVSRPRHFGLLCRQRNAARSGVRALLGTTVYPNVSDSYETVASLE